MHSLCLFLLLSAPAGATLRTPLQTPAPAPSPAQEPAGNAADAGGEFEQLLEAYASATFEHRRATRAARKAGTAEPRHPIADFWPRFEVLAKTGEGRALLWLALEADELDLPAEELTARKRELFKSLVEKHAAAPWIEPFVKQAAGEERWLGAEAVDEHLRAIFERNESGDVRATAGLKLASRLRERSPEAAKIVYRRLVEAFPDSKVAKEAARQLGTLSIAVGELAPDFEAVDVDGAAFKLSDYRGKVVVLDFWGFW